jgi:hypothetical protein
MYDSAIHISGSPLLATHVWVELLGQIRLGFHRTRVKVVPLLPPASISISAASSQCPACSHVFWHAKRYMHKASRLPYAEGPAMSNRRG